MLITLLDDCRGEDELVGIEITNLAFVWRDRGKARRAYSSTKIRVGCLANTSIMVHIRVLYYSLSSVCEPQSANCVCLCGCLGLEAFQLADFTVCISRVVL